MTNTRGRTNAEKNNDIKKQRTIRNSAFSFSPKAEAKKPVIESVAMYLNLVFLHNKVRQSHHFGRHTSAFRFDPYLLNKGHWV